MKIRNLITLWITGAGLLAAILFSIVIFYELIEQPFELIDKELDSHAYTLLVGLSPQNGSMTSPSSTAMVESLGNSYWFKIFDRQQKLIYASRMTGFIDIPLRHKRRYNVHIAVPPELAHLNQDKSNQVTFRVSLSTIPFGGQRYTIQIAKPMEKLWKEIVELSIAIGVGLLFFTLTLILLGYFIAGKIIQPIVEINALAQEINDKTLDKRIPLGKNHDELHALSSSLNQMFDRLQFSFKRQKELIANASHELKTPIAMQQLFFGEAVQREDLPEDFRMKLVSQAEATLRMKQLVKNLLELSALELNETLDARPVNLTELSESVFQEFDDIIETAGIELSLETSGPIQCSGDREKLRRMLINLVDNAIKYNHRQGGEIRFALRKRGGMVQMTISNSGRIIPEDELDSVFNQFYRVEKSRSTAHGGSGLGLTIVKRIVELHRGTITISSNSDPVDHVLLTILLPL